MSDQKRIDDLSLDSGFPGESGAEEFEGSVVYAPRLWREWWAFSKLLESLGIWGPQEIRTWSNQENGGIVYYLVNDEVVRV